MMLPGIPHGQVLGIGIGAFILEWEHGNRVDWPATFRVIFRRNVKRHQETVAAAREGFDETGVVGRIAQGLAQLVDGLVQAVIEIDERVGGPEPITQFFASDDLAGIFKQHCQNLYRLLLNLDLDAFFTKFSRAQIQLK